MTNDKVNEFQGTLRFGYLNLDLLAETIYNDLGSVPCDIPITPNIGVSCLDQVSQATYFSDGDYHSCSKDKQFKSVLKEKLDYYFQPNTFYWSTGPTIMDISTDWY